MLLAWHAHSSYEHILKICIPSFKKEHRITAFISFCMLVKHSWYWEPTKAGHAHASSYFPWRSRASVKQGLWCVQLLGPSQGCALGHLQTQHLSVVTRVGFLWIWGPNLERWLDFLWVPKQFWLTVIMTDCHYDGLFICLCRDLSQDPVLAMLCLFPTHITEGFWFCMDSSNTSHGSAARMLFSLHNVFLY